MAVKTTFKGFYGKTTDGKIVYVINSGVCADGTPAYKAEYCILGRPFCGGGMAIGQDIIGTKKIGWFPQSKITRNKKGQNGTIWN